MSKSKNSWIVLILVIIVFLISGCGSSEQQISEPIYANSGELQPLKIFGESQITGIIININDSIANVKIKEISDYTFLESQLKLIDVGDNIIIYFTGVGNKENWNTRLLSINTSFSSKIRCLDGRINSREQFTKEKCYWEVNEGDIIIR